MRATALREAQFGSAHVDSKVNPAGNGKRISVVPPAFVSAEAKFRAGVGVTLNARAESKQSFGRISYAINSKLSI